MKSSTTIPIAIIIGGIIVAVAVYTSMPKQPSRSDGNPALVRPVDGTDHIFGNPAAKVRIVEYTDFDCQYCKGFHEVMHQLIANEGVNGDVAWVLREFPLTEIHENAMQNASAAECAAQVGGSDAFWKFADTLFNHQPIDPTKYGTYASEAGLTGTDFATCLANASTTVAARVLADRANALLIGAKGTPYSLIIIDGKAPVVLDGGYPYGDLKDLVDEARASANK